MPRGQLIKFRRGSAAPLAADFQEAEPAWDSTNKQLFVKAADGLMVPIGSGQIIASGLTMTAARVLIGPASGVGAPREATLASDVIIDGTVIRALKDFPVALSDETTALTTGVRVTISYWPRASVLTDIPIWMVGTAPVGSAIQLDIRVGGTSIFSTLPTIAASSLSSVGGTPAVFSTAFVSNSQQIAAGSVVTFHVLQIGSSTAGAGLKVFVPMRRAG